MIGDGKSAWVSESVQQSLQADLRNAVVSHAGAVEMDDAEAIARVAKNAGVDEVVSGHIQVIGDRVRITASLCNSAGALVGTGKATGALDHLFDLEDALADQIRDGLAKAASAKHPITTPIPDMPTAGPLVMAPAKSYPIGTVPAAFTSAALQDGRDRYIYQVPYYGCCGGWGYGCAYGGWAFGGFGCGWGAGGCGVFNGSYSTGGQHSLAW
jgi:TolB-like protein